MNIDYDSWLMSDPDDGDFGVTCTCDDPDCESCNARKAEDNRLENRFEQDWLERHGG